MTDLNTQTDTAQHNAPMAPVDLDTPVAAPAINGFAALGLMEPIVRAVAAEGYTTPSPIQMQAIGPLLAGRDLLGIAQTGTGKTAAFALPILHRLAANRVAPMPRTTRALILSPTRELATQIGEMFKIYGAGLGFRVNLKKGDFIGRAALTRQKEQGIRQKLCTLTLDKPLPLYGGEAVIHGGKVVGVTSSGNFSYTLGRSVAYAYLPIELADKQGFTVESFTEQSPATRHDGPLYDPKNERLKA